jgi:hypothetical protein
LEQKSECPTCRTKITVDGVAAARAAHLQARLNPNNVQPPTEQPRAPVSSANHGSAARDPTSNVASGSSPTSSVAPASPPLPELMRQPVVVAAPPTQSVVSPTVASSPFVSGVAGPLSTGLLMPLLQPPPFLPVLNSGPYSALLAQQQTQLFQQYITHLQLQLDHARVLLSHHLMTQETVFGDIASSLSTPELKVDSSAFVMASSHVATASSSSASSSVSLSTGASTLNQSASSSSASVGDAVEAKADSQDSKQLLLPPPLESSDTVVSPVPTSLHANVVALSLSEAASADNRNDRTEDSEPVQPSPIQRTLSQREVLAAAMAQRLSPKKTSTPTTTEASE